MKRDLLRPRNHEINLNDKIGKRTEITEDTDVSERSGWYCDVCKCQLKDSHTYLDHINGKKHQRVLGMSMRTPTSTLHQVKQRFEYHKKRSRGEFEEMDVAERIEMRRAKEKRQRELRKQNKKKRKLARKQAEADESYGTTHNAVDDQHEYKKRGNAKESKESKESAAEQTEYVKEGIDPEMAAMGFTFGFGGSKKT